MNATPLPLADVLPAASGTFPAAGENLQALVDPRLAADVAGTPRGAADFAALLLQSYGRTETRVEEPAGPTNETLAEVPTEPAGPALAIDALLFITALQTPSVGTLAVTRLPALPTVDALAAPEIDVMPLLRGAAPLPAAAPTFDGLGQGLADPSRLPLIASVEVGAWAPKLPGLEIRKATPDHHESVRHVPVAHLGPPAADADAVADGTKRVPDVLIDAKPAVAGSAGSQATPVPAPVAAVEPTPSLLTAANVSSPSPPSAVSVTVETPVHETAWRIDVANRIAGLVTRGVEHAELRVTPPELGPVELRIDLRGAEATLAIVAPQATTRDALEQALPLLRDMLAQHGLALGEATVRDGREQNPANDGGHVARGAGAQDSDVPQLADARPALVRRLVDVFA